MHLFPSPLYDAAMATALIFEPGKMGNKNLPKGHARLIKW
jgi:hypothetical protein